MAAGWDDGVKKRAVMPVFPNKPDWFPALEYLSPPYCQRLRGKTYLPEEAATGFSLKIISSVRTTVRPVESGEMIITTFRPG